MISCLKMFILSLAVVRVTKKKAQWHIVFVFPLSLIPFQKAFFLCSEHGDQVYPHLGVPRETPCTYTRLG